MEKTEKDPLSERLQLFENQIVPSLLYKGYTIFILDNLVYRISKFSYITDYFISSQKVFIHNTKKWYTCLNLLKFYK